MAWELKVGYQSAGQTNVNQIDFDEQLLSNKSRDYYHFTTPVNITQIMWWDVPQAGGSVGLSADLAMDLKEAVDRSHGHYNVEVDFPYDSSDGGGTSSTGASSAAPWWHIPVGIPAPEPVPVASYNPGSTCGAWV